MVPEARGKLWDCRSGVPVEILRNEEPFVDTHLNSRWILEEAVSFPDRDIVCCLLHRGFTLGMTEVFPWGRTVLHPNQKNALACVEKVSVALKDELLHHRLEGPFRALPLVPCICEPLGAVPHKYKPDRERPTFNHSALGFDDVGHALAPNERVCGLK